jgi:hypothetical protein
MTVGRHFRDEKQLVVARRCRSGDGCEGRVGGGEHPADASGRINKF